MKQFSRHVCSFLFLAIAIPIAGFSQKAFVTTQYQSSVNKLKVTFNLADGYVPGNELKLYNKVSRTTARFLPENNAIDETRPTKFYHFSPSGKKFRDYFLVDNLKEKFEAMPAKIIARYYNNARIVKFTLARK